MAETTCPACGGFGYLPGGPPDLLLAMNCPGCGGTGRVPEAANPIPANEPGEAR